MKTYVVKPVDIKREWLVVDAAGQTLGRLATVIAKHLIGKHKPLYTAHIDCGDNVVVTNARRIRVSGNKLKDKKYYHYSGYPGGMRETNLERLMEKAPEKVIELAVKGMLPKNKLQAERLKRLKVYPTAEHPHSPQSPKPLGAVSGR